MVKKINTSLMNAGKLRSIKGVIIHNDAGRMTPEQYVEWLRGRDKTLGIAHYYITKETIARVVDTYNVAWHAGDGGGDGNYCHIGYEVCQSLSASDVDFLANEDMTLRQAAEDLLFYGLPINTSTVRLHHEFTQTTCPHRSMALHGGTTASVKKYFVDRMKYFASLGKTVDEMLEAERKIATGEVKKVTAKKEERKGTATGSKYPAAFRELPLGLKVEVRKEATGFADGKLIPTSVNGQKYKIKGVQEYNKSYSKRAYTLDCGLVLEQDIVEAW